MHCVDQVIFVLVSRRSAAALEKKKKIAKSFLTNYGKHVGRRVFKFCTDSSLKSIYCIVSLKICLRCPSQENKVFQEKGQQHQQQLEA